MDDLLNCNLGQYGRLSILEPPKSTGVSWCQFCYCDLWILQLRPACLCVILQWKATVLEDGCDPVLRATGVQWRGDQVVKQISHFGSSGLVEPVNVMDNGDGTHTVTYTPSQEGPYIVSVKYADEEIPRRWASQPSGMGPLHPQDW